MAEQLTSAPLTSAARAGPAGAGAPAPILRALAECGPAQFPTLAGQMARLFCKALDADLAAGDNTDSLCHYFLPALDRLHFRAMQVPDCFILHSEDASHHVVDSALRKSLSSGTDIPLLLCSCEEKAREVSTKIPKGRAVILPPEVFARIIESSGTDALAALREAILAQIHPLRVQPYDTTRPATGNMFFGRELEMKLLLYSETQSFIITGPSKIGKTSLVMQFIWTLRRLRDPRLATTHYITFQPCERMGPDDIARYFARHFRDNHYTRVGLRFDDLRNFVGTLRAATSGPLTLILDEADAVCHTSLLTLLADFAREGVLRLIVLGRGAMRRHWLQNRASGFSRFRELRPAGLIPGVAASLVCDVLGELGYAIENREAFCAELLRMTASQPFHLQHCARGVLELAIAEETTTITVDMLHRTTDSFVDLGRLRSHLNDLHTPQARLAAACLLQSGDLQHFSIDSVRTLLRERGLSHDTNSAIAICEDLVINHLLGWDEHGFSAPPWDMCEIARKHPQIMRNFRDEYLEASRCHLNAR